MATAKTKTTKKTKKSKNRILTSAELESMRKPLRSTIRAFTKILDKGVAFPEKKKQIEKLRKKLIEINEQFNWSVSIQ